MSPQVSCKSKGQHLFSLLVFIACSSGSNSGLGRAFQVVVMFIDSFMDDVTYVRGVKFCM
jgi:hypothetical protein